MRYKPFYKRFSYMAGFVILFYVLFKSAMLIGLREIPQIYDIEPPKDIRQIIEIGMFDRGFLFSSGTESVVNFLSYSNYKNKKVKIFVLTVAERSEIWSDYSLEKAPRYILQEWMYNNGITRAVVIFMSANDNFIKIGISKSLETYISEMDCQELLGNHFYPYVKRKFYHRILYDYIVPLLFVPGIDNDRGYDNAIKQLLQAIDKKL